MQVAGHHRIDYKLPIRLNFDVLGNLVQLELDQDLAKDVMTTGGV